MSTAPALSLIVRRTIAADPARLFAAWTTPEELLRWWGPRDVTCTLAELDLRAGGRYVLGNKLPDGTVVFIEGEFLAVDPPHRLVYSWGMRGQTTPPERVTVRFEACDGGTDVIVLHERIANEASRASHAQGWDGCFEGLLELV